jgi:nicotinamidase-related amidase
MPIILVQVGFRAGLPEVGSRNKLFNAIKSWPQHKKVLYEGTIDPIHPALGPEGADIIVTKRRVSSFAGTELELLLRAKEIETLVLFGLSTSGAVLSTVLDASDADYKLVVMSDCCADTDSELHGVLVNRLFPQRAEVLTAHSVHRGALKASN